MSMNFPVGWLLERLERRFDALAAQRGLELRIISSSARICSDPVLLAQILDHLVENAVVHTAEGRVLVGCRRREDLLSIDIRDTGSGMVNAVRQPLSSCQGGGRAPVRDGIGLAVVERLARLLRHPVLVSGAAGLGTQISIRVPLAETTRRPAGKGPARGRDGGRRVLVVIDDEEQVLAGLRLLLEAWQYDVLAASSEDEAIATLLESGQRPLGIIADYRLRGGRTGTQAVRHICSMFEDRIPSIIITGDISAGRLCDQEGSSLVVLQKPVTAPYLQAVLSQTFAPR